MRDGRYGAVLGTLFGLVIAAHAVGCGTAWEDYYKLLTDPKLASGSGGTGGGIPGGCVPSDNAQPVDDKCGVFVSSSKGTDGAAGTKSAPLKTLAEAIGKANGGAVYACAEAFAGSVTLASGTTIFGGLDCAKDWAYVGATTKSALMGDADKPALLIESTASGAKVEDFAITAANAVTAGASSIAVVVDVASAGFSRCDLIAGDAMPGAAGAAYPSAAQAGMSGLAGMDACTANIVNPGDSVSSGCGMSDSTSGPGGSGFAGSGGPGAPGQPGATMNGGAGATMAAVCAAGGVGDIGTAAMPGAGATGTGTIDKTGYSGAAGMPGTAGGPGQGGGGGGGAKGGTAANQCMVGMAGGASGGSGGSGGCGGAGGKPGSAAGSSIGLISLKASVTFTDVKVRTGNGGAGGDGGPGQDGGIGGPPGDGGKVPMGLNLNPGCKGGNGGSGGKGGQGGGGQGGHAIGIAYTGAEPPMAGVTFDKKGTAGKGGAGADAMHDGAAGVQMDVQLFP